MELIPPTQDADWFNGLDNISEHPQLTSHPATYSGVAASPVPYPNNQFSGLADTPGLSGLDVPLSFPYPGVAASSVPFAIGRPNNDQLMISGLANAPQFSGLANTSDLFGLDVPFSIPDPDVYPSSVASPVSFGRHQNSFSPTSTPMQFQNFLPVSTLAHADSLWHDVGPISEEQCSDLNYGESSTYNRQYEPLPSNLPTLLSASGYSLEEEAPIVTCQENTPSQLQLGGFVCLNHCDGKFIGPHSCFRYGTELLITCRYQNCSYKHAFKTQDDFTQHPKSFHSRLLIDCPVAGCPRVGVKGFLGRIIWCSTGEVFMVRKFGRKI